jgi:hypothetical protein
MKSDVDVCQDEPVLGVPYQGKEYLQFGLSATKHENTPFSVSKGVLFVLITMLRVITLALLVQTLVNLVEAAFQREPTLSSALMLVPTQSRFMVKPLCLKWDLDTHQGHTLSQTLFSWITDCKIFT